MACIVQVNISPGGLPKRAIAAGMITPLGLAGDLCAHPQIHGGPRQAVLLIAAEVVDELKSRGYPVFYGALGENLTTRGIDRLQLRIGHQLRVGGAILEITNVRGPCAALDIYGAEIKAGDLRFQCDGGRLRFATVGHERILCARSPARPRRAWGSRFIAGGSGLTPIRFTLVGQAIAPGGLPIWHAQGRRRKTIVCPTPISPTTRRETSSQPSPR